MRITVIIIPRTSHLECVYVCACRYEIIYIYIHIFEFTVRDIRRCVMQLRCEDTLDQSYHA